VNRRALLTGVALALAGCNTPDADGDGDTPQQTDAPTDEPTATATDGGDVTPHPEDPMLIRVSNGTDRERTVTLTLTRGDDTVLEETVTLAPGGRTTVDPDITEQGDYELRAETADGATGRMPFDVGGYELRSGSNLIVSVGDETLRILIEE